MGILYKGIEIDAPAGPVSMTHSVFIDMIRKESGTKNMDWTEMLGNIPWSKVKDIRPEAFEKAGRLFSLMNMDYQVCNGGIGQYFLNGYDEARDPFHENDVMGYDIDAQKEAFHELVAFGREIFPDRTDENDTLAKAASAFQEVHIERDAELYETIYCDEDQYIEDEETGETIENPDYFEPYEEMYHEDVIHGDVAFEDIFYDASDYMEELMELYAQAQCKLLARSTHDFSKDHFQALEALKGVLPESAFKKPSLQTLVQNAMSRANSTPEEDRSVQKDMASQH